ncbi:aminopeptidase N-like [Chironomus tepperi]|uniref:aminopeptidase N-like n=1 Tax=Chironomus tepperi TaxID=113505 RepID=UPI00391F41FF
MLWLKVAFGAILMVNFVCSSPVDKLYLDNEIGETKFKSIPKSDKLYNLDDPATYRLPNNSIPVEYYITLETNIHEGDFNFLGNVIIHIKIVEETNQVTLHYRQISITRIEIIDPVLQLVIVSNATYNYIESHDFLVIDLPITYQPDTELILNIDYNGKLRDEGAGFYWGSYNNSQNETKYYGATQFETTDARHAMPCYDEPGIRAVMHLTIIHGKSYTAIANTEAVGHYDTVDGKVVTVFAPTPKMQTYLLAFIISDFDHVNATNSRVPQRIFGTPKVIEEGQGDYAATVVGPILDKLEEILHIEYPLSKMDHAALTKFDSGAMENFGLITYIERNLVLNPALSLSAKYSQQGSIISIVAHELVHQWFGNIVSPTWWTYTWLNEGFATFFASYIPSLVYPERRPMRSFFSYLTFVAFMSDEDGSWAMNHYTEDPKELDSKFDGIGYHKSACVLRMFMEVMTEPVFLKGLNYYLTDNYMKAATPTQLHKGLQTALDEAFPGNLLDLNTIMYSWEDQAGYPLISVNVSGTNLVFSQRRYPKSNGEIYSVPITFATKTNPDFAVRTPKVWLPTASMSVDQKLIGYTANDWMIVNIDQVGYYRVDYDTTLWRANIEQLNKDHKVINELNRALLLDEFYLAWTQFNRVNAADALNILNYFGKEDENNAWARGQTTYNILKNRLFGTPVYEKFAEFIRAKTKPHLDILGYEGFDGEDPDRASLRSYAKQWSCQSIDRDCYLLEQQKFIAYYNGSGGLNFNFCYAMKLVEDPIYTQIVIGITTSSNFPNRAEFVRNLGCSLRVDNLNVLLLEILNSGNNLSNIERENLLTGMFSNSELGLKTALKFIDESYTPLSSIIDLPKIMSSMAGYINGEEMTAKFRETVEKLKAGQHLSDANHLAISKTLETSEKWFTTNYKDISDYFGLDDTTTGVPSTTPDSGTSVLISFSLICLCTLMSLIRSIK